MIAIITDLFGNTVRLTDERWDHIKERKEMIDQLEKIQETLSLPDIIKLSNFDSEVHVYYKYYSVTPVSSKYLAVVVKI